MLIQFFSLFVPKLMIMWCPISLAFSCTLRLWLQNSMPYKMDLKGELIVDNIKLSVWFAGFISQTSQYKKIFKISWINFYDKNLQKTPINWLKFIFKHTYFKFLILSKNRIMTIWILINPKIDKNNCICDQLHEIDLFFFFIFQVQYQQRN